MLTYSDVCLSWHQDAEKKTTHQHECWRMLTYADVMLTYALTRHLDAATRTANQQRMHPSLWSMLTYADVCWRMLTYADVCWRMLTGRGKKGQPISIECTPRFDFKHLNKIPLETQDVYLYHSYEWCNAYACVCVCVFVCVSVSVSLSVSVSVFVCQCQCQFQCL